MVRPCPRCWYEDSWGREEFVSRPLPCKRGPSPTDVYNAVFSFYDHDRTVPHADSWYLAREFVALGHLNSMPTLADVGHAQRLIHEGHRRQRKSS